MSKHWSLHIVQLFVWPSDKGYFECVYHESRKHAICVSVELLGSVTGQMDTPLLLITPSYFYDKDTQSHSLHVFAILCVHVCVWVWVRCVFTVI